MSMRTFPPIIVLVLGILSAPSPASGSPGIVRLWAAAHGTLVNGQGNYFSTEQGPYVGYGGQLGLQFVALEAFVDVNILDSGQDAREDTPTMWNAIGGGIRVPVPLGSDKVRLYGRAHGAFTYAPFPGQPGSDNNRGFVIRGGGGVACQAGSTSRDPPLCTYRS